MGVFYAARRDIYASHTNVQPRPSYMTLEERVGIKKYSCSAKPGFNIANSSCVRGTTAMTDSSTTMSPSSWLFLSPLIFQVRRRTETSLA